MVVFDIYRGGSFHKAAVDALVRDAELSDAGYTVVAALGVPGVHKSALLNEVFGSDFVEADGADGYSQQQQQQQSQQQQQRCGSQFGSCNAGVRGRAGSSTSSASSDAATGGGGGGGDLAGPGPRDGRVLGARAEPLNRSLVLAQQPRDVLLLDVDGLSPMEADSAGRAARDGRAQRAHEQRTTAVNLGVALADVIVFSVHLHDLSRTRASGMRQLRAALETHLRLRAAGMLSSATSSAGGGGGRGGAAQQRARNKRLIAVVVRDFDEESVSREELVSAFLEDFAALWNKMSKPARFAHSRYSDMFDFEFATLPHSTLRKVEFMRRVGELQRQFLDPTADNYLFEDDRYAGVIPHAELATHAESVYKALQKAEREAAESLYGAGGASGASAKELEASYRCDEVSNYIFSQYLASVRSWKARAEDGRIIENFGSEAEALLQSSLAEYDRDAGAHSGAKSFSRKRGELRAALLNDLRAIFVKQVLKLREVAFDRFKLQLTRIRVTDRVEKDVDQYIKETEKYFQEQAELLKCRDAPRSGTAAMSGAAASGTLAWRHDVERRALVDAMREVATERLQFARLQGAYVPEQRQPIACSFHYLHPNPFGMDSRFDKPSTSDPMRFDSDAARKSSVMRLNARQRAGAKVRAPRSKLRPADDGQSESDWVYHDDAGK